MTPEERDQELTEMEYELEFLVSDKVEADKATIAKRGVDLHTRFERFRNLHREWSDTDRERCLNGQQRLLKEIFSIDVTLKALNRFVRN